jgi:hypothetical protein
MTMFTVVQNLLGGIKVRIHGRMIGHPFHLADDNGAILFQVGNSVEDLGHLQGDDDVGTALGDLWTDAVTRPDMTAYGAAQLGEA